VFAAAVLALLTLLAFSNSFSAGFVLDNKGLLLQDPRLRELTGKNIRLILQHTYWWPAGESGLYRPFTTLSYLFNYAVLGNADAPVGYHWINFLLHLANVFLVYALARRVFGTQSFAPRNSRTHGPAQAPTSALHNPGTLSNSGALSNPANPRPSAFFVAALWAVHPVLTESVTNMIGRSDLLCALAVLGGFLMYLKGTESTGLRRFAWLAGLMAVTAVGVFSKESAVVIVAVIVLYELTWWRERKPGRALLLGCLATLAPIAAMLYQRARVLATAPPAEFPFTDNPIVGAGFWIGRLTAIKVIPRYLGLILLPAHLSSDYSYAQIPLAKGDWQDWAACIVVLAAVIFVVALYWGNRKAFFLMSFAAITFVPTSNLLFPIGTPMAERFLYLPAVGLLACLVMAIYAVGKRVPVRHFAPGVLCVITAAFALRTWVRNGDWQDERSMAEAVIRTCPNSYKGHLFLATVLDANRAADSNRDHALAEADRVLAILDSLPDGRNTVVPYDRAGGMHLAKGDYWHEQGSSQSAQEYQRAAQILERAIAIEKSSRAEYLRRGGAEWARRHPRAAAIAQSDPEAHWMLAAAYWRLEKMPEAAAAASDALALHPTDPEGYRQIAFAFASDNRFNEAAVALFEGLLITSDSSFRSTLLNLYRSAYSDSCAITAGPNGPEVNFACDLVHNQFCAASVEAVKAAIEEGRWDVAKQQKQLFVHAYGCPPGPLEQVSPN